MTDGRWHRFRILAGTLLGLAVILAGCTRDPAGLPQPGAVALPLALTGLAGEAIELRPQPGQPLWLSFWASWCYPCRTEWPELDQAQRELASAGVKLIGVNVADPAETVTTFLAEHPTAMTVVRDPEGRAAQRYGVTGFPTHILIDADGTVRSVVRGPLNARRARILLGLP